MGKKKSGAKKKGKAKKKGSVAKKEEEKQRVPFSVKQLDIIFIFFSLIIVSIIRNLNKIKK